MDENSLRDRFLKELRNQIEWWAKSTARRLTDPADETPTLAEEAYVEVRQALLAQKVPPATVELVLDVALSGLAHSFLCTAGRRHSAFEQGPRSLSR